MNGKKIMIANRCVGNRQPCFIIAEAGVNHNGDFSLAKLLIDEASKAGADAVKFQTFKTENLVTHTAEKSDYQKKNDPGSDTQFDMLKNLELTENQFKKLSQYAKKKGIIFLSTAFDIESLDILSRLEVPAFKIPSGEITNFPYLKKVAEEKKPVILSTGMSTLNEVKEAVSYLKKHGSTGIILLHCTTSYPVPLRSVNLRVLGSLRRKFGLPIGYSDHTEGIMVPIAAVALGSCVIEKHFTLDKCMPGPDHKSSLEPQEFTNMVTAIRQIELAMGNTLKKPDAVELCNRNLVRKSIVALKNIKKDTILTEQMLTIKRPGTGIEPKNFEKIIGKKARSAIKKDTVLLWDMIE